MVKVSVNEFKKRLKGDINEICSDNKWDFNSNAERGYAFQLWCANQIVAIDQRVETNPIDGMLYSKDLNADVVLEDSVMKHLYIVQAKYQGASGKMKNTGEDEIVSFLERHKLFLDDEWVRRNGSEGAVALLSDYKEKLEDGYKASFYFMTTSKASDRIFELFEKKNEQLTEEKYSVEYSLYDFPRLKEYYIRSFTAEESIPDEVTLSLPKEKYFHKNEPLPTVVCAIKGNSLRNLYNQYKDSLFAYNIRTFLGDRGINKAIIETIKNHPKDFFYYNNGVSAICTELKIEKDQLTAKKFQIINGAQTVGALARAKDNPDVDIIFRISETENVATEKGINANIIRYNNSQNKIKISDFRSNDTIQQWLEVKFKETKPKGILPNLLYAPKRGFRKAPPGSKTIKLEDLAKYRYAFKEDPTLILKSPKDLWTDKENGGCYEKAFGVNNELVDYWSDDEFEEALLAIAIYNEIDSRLRKLKKKTPELGSISRLKFHALSAMGIFYRKTNHNLTAKKIYGHEKIFNEFFDSYWRDINRLLIDQYHIAIESGISIYALSRNSEKWRGMKKRIEHYSKAEEGD